MAIPDNTPQNPADLMPPNATPLERAINAAAADQLNRLPRNVARRLWNADTCPLEFLPWLAWTVGVEVWDSNWPENVKRARVKEAIPIARLKGTRGSIDRVLKSYGGDFAIQEWWQKNPKGIPHTFELSLNLSGAGGKEATAEFIEAVIDDINRTKPLRSHYTVIQGLKAKGELQIVAAVRTVIEVNLSMQTDIKPVDTTATVAIAGATRVLVQIRLKATMQ